MPNTPKIETQRLILRKFTSNDLEAFCNIINDKEVNMFLPWPPFTTKEEAEHHLQDMYLKSYENSVGFRYAICLKPYNKLIGYVNVSEDDSYDFGYGLKKEYWHKGIITEACIAVLKQLRKSGIPYITATHDVNNPRSGGVMKNIGMHYCYSFEELTFPKNILETFRMYQLNFNGHEEFTYMKYWNKSSVHFVEKEV